MYTSSVVMWNNNPKTQIGTGADLYFWSARQSLTFKQLRC
jgi:hypothetical protein